jgi:hypothetical protein
MAMLGHDVFNVRLLVSNRSNADLPSKGLGGLVEDLEQ